MTTPLNNPPAHRNPRPDTKFAAVPAPIAPSDTPSTPMPPIPLVLPPRRPSRQPSSAPAAFMPAQAWLFIERIYQSNDPGDATLVIRFTTHINPNSRVDPRDFTFNLDGFQWFPALPPISPYPFADRHIAIVGLTTDWDPAPERGVFYTGENSRIFDWSGRILPRFGAFPYTRL